MARQQALAAIRYVLAADIRRVCRSMVPAAAIYRYCIGWPGPQARLTGEA